MSIRTKVSLLGAVVMALSLAGAPSGAFGATPSQHIDTTVTTSLPNFEFNAFFGPPFPVISCELDHNFKSPGAKPFSQAYCMSSTPKFTHHVVMMTSGALKKCVGATCGSNPGLGTPDFAPGTMVKSGPFTCAVLKKAVKCTVASGHGFALTLSTITKI